MQQLETIHSDELWQAAVELGRQLLHLSRSSEMASASPFEGDWEKLANELPRHIAQAHLAQNVAVERDELLKALEKARAIDDRLLQLADQEAASLKTLARIFCKADQFRERTLLRLKATASLCRSA